MDCVAGWWDGTYCQDEGAYQKEWQKRFGLSTEDRELFHQYDALRKRYYKGQGMPADEPGPFTDGLFAKRSAIDEDLIAPKFLASGTIAEALDKLSDTVSAKDLAFLRQFYARFKPGYDQLLIESEPFKKKALELQQRMRAPGYQAFFAEVMKYYSVTEPLRYEVRFAWWPPLARDLAFPLDRFILLMKNPVQQMDWDDEEVIFHEVVHTISARQPQRQKQEISAAVTSMCAAEAKVGRAKLLEEPLAVAIGQVIFLQRFHPERLHLEAKLYNNYWISAFAKLIHPVVSEDLKAGRKLSLQTGKKLGALCAELLNTHQQLKAAEGG